MGDILSAADRRALTILRDHGPLRPLRFAGRMWPDSPGWQVVKNCGNHGASRGVGMSLAGAGLLGKLARRGLAQRRYCYHGRAFEGYALTDAGLLALRAIVD